LEVKTRGKNGWEKEGRGKGRMDYAKPLAI